MSRKLALAAAAAAIIATAAQPAAAWEVTRNTARDGVPFCLANTRLDASATVVFMTRADSQTVWLQLAFDAWPVVERGLPVQAVLTIDRERWTMEGFTGVIGGKASIHFPIPNNAEGAAVMAAWGLGQRLTVTFPNGAAGVTANLTGSMAALARLAECVDSLRPRSPSPAARSPSPAAPPVSPASRPAAVPGGRWS
jgi:hypothetical protein